VTSGAQFLASERLPRGVFGNHARFAEIHLARHLLHQRFRAWCDRRDLKRTLQKPFEEESAHEGGIVGRRLFLVQSGYEAVVGLKP